MKKRLLFTLFSLLCFTLFLLSCQEQSTGSTQPKESTSPLISTSVGATSSAVDTMPILPTLSTPPSTTSAVTSTALELVTTPKAPTTEQPVDTTQKPFISEKPMETTNAPITTTVAPQTTTVPVITTVPDTTPAIPESYFTRLDVAVSGSQVVIPAKYNPGIACDIYPIISGGKLYFLLPSAQDLSQVVYEIYNENGKLRMGRVADFTSESDTGKKLILNSKHYTIEALRSDSPTLFIELDESYADLDDVKNDVTKQTKAYGRLILTCREDIAKQNGWDTTYISKENDADSPHTMYIKGRGNWTWLDTEKKGFSIKLEKKDDLLGMGKSKKWALIGNVTDNTMLRNTLASYLGKEAGFAYTPSSEIVDVFVNGEYQGAFLLSEKVSIAENRIAITDLEDKIDDMMTDEDYGEQVTKRNSSIGVTMKYWTKVPNPDDITGGYILEMEMADRFEKEKSGFITRKGFRYVIKSPEYASYAQVKYIATLMQEAEDALFAPDGYHPETGKHYTEYMDLDSFVKKYWVDEISKNRDGAKTSHYLYKGADSESEKIFAGPLWDYDIAFGISSETVNPEGWFSRIEKDFYRACWKKTDFRQRAWELFDEIFYPAVDRFARIGITAAAEKIAPSVEMNDLLWHQMNRDYMSYVEDLKTYIQKRITWINSQKP